MNCKILIPNKKIYSETSEKFFIDDKQISRSSSVSIEEIYYSKVKEILMYPLFPLRYSIAQLLEPRLIEKLGY